MDFNISSTNQIPQPQPGMYYTTGPAIPMFQPGQYSSLPVAYPSQLQMANEQQPQGNIQPNFYYPMQNLQYTNPTPLPQSQTNESQEWKIVENKKRNRTSPDKRSVKQTKINDYWLNTPTTSNRFEQLGNDVDAEQQMDNEEQKEPKPPPIFIKGVKNITPLTTLLNHITKNGYEIKVLGYDQIKVQPKTVEYYKTITQALIDKKTEFHTYRPKEERSFRVVLKNMHNSVNLTELKEAIEAQGHVVENIWNIKHFKTKQPLPMFFIDLQPDVNNKKIYDIENLLFYKVKFEPPRQKRDIPQCARCQRYGHTKKYCQHRPRCVKCTEDHATVDCPRKEKSTNVKCVLCEGNHPANYKGCSIYKELQKKKYPPLRQKPNTTMQRREQTDQPGTSYAQICKGQQQEFAGNNTQPVNIQQYLPATNDMAELKHMMKGLMEQMGTMLNLLTTVISKLK